MQNLLQNRHEKDDPFSRPPRVSDVGSSFFEVEGGRNAIVIRCTLRLSVFTKHRLK